MQAPMRPSGMRLPPPPGFGQFTLEQVARHNTERDCWMVLNGQVVDVTSFLQQHPGGQAVLSAHAGQNATQEFNAVHDASYVGNYLQGGVMGRLRGSAKM